MAAGEGEEEEKLGQGRYWERDQEDVEIKVKVLELRGEVPGLGSVYRGVREVQGG